MKTKLLTAILSAATLSTAYASTNAINQNISDDYVSSGDYLQILIPATGLLAAWLHEDPQGAKQLALSVGAAQVIVQGGKKIVGRVRPNGNGTSSFPSGHTAAAFSGAAFLQSRYGSAWGIPAYVAASYVGLSRMHGNRHHADDVLAAAGISFLVNQYIVSPFQPENVAFTAVPKEDGVSFGVSFANEFFAKQSRQAYEQRTSGPQNHRIELDIGFNLEDSLRKAGLPGSTLVDEVQPFASLTYDYQINEDSFLEVNLSPNETRQYGQTEYSFDFEGNHYEAGEDVYLAFRQWSLGATYNRAFELTDNLTASLGAGAAGYILDFEIDKNNGGKHSRVTEYRIMPTLNSHLDYEVVDDLHTFAHVQYQKLKSDSVLLAEAGVRYDLNKEWDVSVKYQHQDANWKSKQLGYQSKSVVLSIANRF
ncbi:phosphatase PAP2 family protein [Vibrio ulleungensis]|uniref:undecaprenyl-diphosphate phosphatase n=1 Tax=Vibrio ulleungensis TaxID=2807619 RepID=A0ABS2HGL4_9VIBR|nr:phosphatase PAP2 family protein [Vibrio ulleungensis]MBM7035602.1 phosphatase PAP2 family protein [Vibrio ulleungensis]